MFNAKFIRFTHEISCPAEIGEVSHLLAGGAGVGAGGAADAEALKCKQSLRFKSYFGITLVVYKCRTDRVQVSPWRNRRTTAKPIIFSGQFLFLNAQFLVLNTKLLVFNTKSMHFTHLALDPTSRGFVEDVLHQLSLLHQKIMIIRLA